MEYQYSESMNKLLERKPNKRLHIILIVLMVITIIGGLLGYLLENNIISNDKKNVQTFNPFNAGSDYSKLTPEYLSDEFATEYDDSVNYLFAIDKDNNSYIVAVKANDMDQYKDLIDYTYSTTGNAPAAVTLQGTPRKIDSEITNLAVDSFNTFCDSDVVSTSNFNSVFGDYYLDTTQLPSGNYTFMSVCIFLFLVCAFIYIYLMDRERKSFKLRKSTLEKFDNTAIKEVDKEINESISIFFNPQNLYCTSNYIISTARGFDIIHLSEIKHVYGCIYGNNQKKPTSSIVVVTNDDIKHEIAVIKLDQKGNLLLGDIINIIKSKLPDITYGFEGGFYTRSASDNSIEIDTDASVSAVSSNVLLGTIGAFIGAALGGVIWIIIGELGFIAGLAGFAMMYFAIKGYSGLSGRLDKKGQIISIIIALVMIFVANYTSYALNFCKYYFDGNYSINNLMDSIKNLSSYLTYSNNWGSFLKDLAIGYALSIWSGFGIIRSVFSKRKNIN